MNTTVDDYVIECGHGADALVKYGKFSATVQQLEDTGQLVSKSGRVHIVPAWAIAKITQAAQVKQTTQA